MAESVPAGPLPPTRFVVPPQSVRRELRLQQIRVATVEGYEVGVSAVFDDTPRFENQYPVGVANEIGRAHV